MKAYFNPDSYLFLERETSFFSIEVEVPLGVLEVVESRRATIDLIDEAIDNSSAPETAAQEWADLFVARLKEEKTLGQE